MRFMSISITLVKSASKPSTIKSGWLGLVAYSPRKSGKPDCPRNCISGMAFGLEPISKFSAIRKEGSKFLKL